MQSFNFTEGEEFLCRAINDWCAQVTLDELTLKEGHIYYIMITSPSGWWYAVNEDGEDGWAPSQFLERVDYCDIENIVAYLEEPEIRKVSNGYIRANNGNIPFDICGIIIAYFLKLYPKLYFDQFDHSLCGASIKISDHDMIVTQISNYDNNNVFGLNVVKSKIHHWTFKIIEYGHALHQKNDIIYIGIWRDDCDAKSVLNKSCLSLNSDLFRPTTVVNGFKNGDYIEMNLDLKKGTLKYRINGTDKQQFSVENDGIPYRVIVGLEGWGHSVELISYSMQE
eukprot:102571_1